MELEWPSAASRVQLNKVENAKPKIRVLPRRTTMTPLLVMRLYIEKSAVLRLLRLFSWELLLFCSPVSAYSTPLQLLYSFSAAKRLESSCVALRKFIISIEGFMSRQMDLYEEDVKMLR
jgi:hypothetical protein